jgi:hypothetical protein
LEVVVAWAITTTFDVSWEDYRRIVDEIGETDLPDGLYFHVAGPEANGIRTMSLWDSEESYTSFVEQRSAPVAARVLGEASATGPTSSVSIGVEHLVMSHAITPVSHQPAFY